MIKHVLFYFFFPTSSIFKPLRVRVDDAGSAGSLALVNEAEGLAGVPGQPPACSLVVRLRVEACTPGCGRCCAREHRC